MIGFLSICVPQVDLCVPLAISIVGRLLESQPLTIHYLKKFLKSLNKIARGISPPPPFHRVSRIEADLETSLTSTIQGTDSLFIMESQHSTLYREQMGVDHFTGAGKPPKKRNELSDADDDDDGSSIYTSRSNSQARSNSALSQDSY